MFIAATPSADALNASVAGALVGAAITAAVTLFVFIIDRVVRGETTFRETRRDVFAELFTVIGAYAVAATAPTGDWASEGAALITARSKVTLALGLRHRSVGVWLTGMESELGSAANMPWKTPSEFFARAELVNARAADIFNALTNLQQHRLFVSDFTLPAGVFHLGELDPSYMIAHRDQVEWAFKPQSEGRWSAIVASVIWYRNRVLEWFKTWRKPLSYVRAP
jgi:hypothetical protein